MVRCKPGVRVASMGAVRDGHSHGVGPYVTGDLSVASLCLLLRDHHNHAYMYKDITDTPVTSYQNPTFLSTNQTRLD